MIRRTIHQYGSEALYHFGAPVYDQVERLLFADAWRSWRNATITLVPDSARTILDLGAGTGAMARACLQNKLPARVIAVEPSRPMIGRRTIRPYGEAVLRANASHLPLRDACIDVVTVGFPGPYVREAATWDELWRVLDQDGMVIALIGGELDPAVPRPWLGRMVGWIVYGSSGSDQSQEQRRLLMPPLVRHTRFVGRWQTLATDRGTCFVWVARRRANP